MCKGQEERERGTEVPRSKRNKKCTGRSGKSGRSFAISAIFSSANFHKERLIGFARKRRKGRSWAGAWKAKRKKKMVCTAKRIPTFRITV